MESVITQKTEHFETPIDLRENLELCFNRIANNKMKIMDRIGFEYKGKHYVLIRDE